MPSTGIEPQVGAIAPMPISTAATNASPSVAGVADASQVAPQTPNVPTPLPALAGQPGRLETTAKRLSVWEDALGAVRAEVVVAVRNTGGSPIAVELTGATWVVSDEAGEPVATGRFAHAFPPLVEPGGEAYLIDGVSAAFAEPDELARLEVQVPGEAVGEQETVVALDVADIRWTPADGGGVEVSGRVENRSVNAVRDAYAAVVLKNDQGEILAAVYDVALGTLSAGESGTFHTDYPGTPPIDPRDVAVVKALARGVPVTTSNSD